jgi:hypothetical protein
MGISREHALLAAGVDTSKGQESGKYLCPRCGKYGIWNKRNSSFCKCFASGGCGWKYPDKNNNEEYTDPVKDAMNSLYCHWHKELLSNDKCGFRKLLLKYLTEERRIDPRVLCAAKIGMVPNTYNPEPIIQSARKRVEENTTDKEARDAALKVFDEDFAEPLRCICKAREGWMAFFYEDGHENMVSANFRKIEKDENGKNIVRMWSPLNYRGVFNPFIGGYTACDRVLVTEGEFNQLQYLSANVRLHGAKWRDEALCCVTAGASSGVDQRALWNVLKQMVVEDEEPLFPVVNEDKDAAGEKVTHEIAKGGFTYHFKLPAKDLDQYIKDTADDAMALETVHDLMASAPMSYRPMETVRIDLDFMRANPPLFENGENEQGKPLKLPQHMLNRKVYEFIEHDIQTRARLFLSAFPYLYMTETHKLIRFHNDSPTMSSLLKQYGLLRTEEHTRLVRENLESFLLLHAKDMDVHKLGCIKPIKDGGHACYVNKGDGQMFRITATNIEVVANGTDDAFLLEENLAPWPDLTPENLTYMSNLRKLLGKYGLKNGITPLCNHYRSLYEKQQLSQEQCEQLSFTRFMFHWVANSVSLWPIETNIGIQNAGKSTKFEKLLKLLYGRTKQGTNLPTDTRSLVAGLSNAAVKLYDNIDSADFTRAQSGFLDTFCGCATGMEASMAMLYHDNVELLFNLRNHLKLTSRVSPFNRSDAMRRTIQLTIRKPSPEEWVDKNVMMNAVDIDRDICLLEVLVRLQNIVRAYDHPSTQRHNQVSEMPEYEAWTYRCAEYEGWYPEMSGIWKTYMAMYNDAIQDNNPMVYGMKAWLGQNRGLNPTNVNREVSVSTLWSEFNLVSRQLGLKQTYKSASSFGKNVSSNMSELRTLGYCDNGLSGGKKRVWFVPTPEQVEECKQLHKDLSSGAYMAQLIGPPMDDLSDGFELVE